VEIEAKKIEKGLLHEKSFKTVGVLSFRHWRTPEWFKAGK